MDARGRKMRPFALNRRGGGRKRRKKAVAVKIERVGNIRADTYVTPCVPKTCVSFVVRSEREKRAEEREGKRRKRRMFVRTFAREKDRKIRPS